MNKSKRIAAVRAMELLARGINDEEIFEYWLINGVEDELIDGTETDEDLEYYITDKHFADLMDTFLWVMKLAWRSGGLYIDNVVSKGDYERRLETTLKRRASCEYGLRKYLK